jgi:hypothetical protein
MFFHVVKLGASADKEFWGDVWRLAETETNRHAKAKVFFLLNV